MAIDSTRRADLTVGMPDLVPGQEAVKRWQAEDQLFHAVSKQMPKAPAFLSGAGR
jgi:hypothetical protein